MAPVNRPVDNSPQSPEDCFAEFDAAFDSLAGQLAWNPETQQSLAAESPMPEATVPIAAPGPVATRVEPDDFMQLEEAFDLLDAQLAGASLAVGRMTPKAAPAAVSAPSPSQVEGAVVSRIEGHSLSPVEGPLRLAASNMQVGVTHRSEPAASFKPVMPKASMHQLMKVTAGVDSARVVSGGVSSMGKVLALLEHLSMIQRRLGLNDGRQWLAEGNNRQIVSGSFADVRQLCLALELQTARVRAEFALAALEANHLDRLTAEIDELVRHLRHDLQSCSIYPIAARRTWLFDLTFRDEVRAAFPSAQADVAEGGQCLALGRYTACAFHVVRGAEHGLEALARAADSKQALPRDEQKWDALIATLESRLTVIDKWSANEAKARAQEFFQEALGDVRALRDTARRLSGGPAARAFDEHEALSILNRTMDFLVRLAERITEAQGRTLVKGDFSR